MDSALCRRARGVAGEMTPAPVIVLTIMIHNHLGVRCHTAFGPKPRVADRRITADEKFGGRHFMRLKVVRYTSVPPVSAPGDLPASGRPGTLRENPHEALAES